MNKLKHLVQSEFLRLTKYNLFTASFVVAMVWVGIGAFLSKEEFILFLPFIFLMESSAMTSLLIGAELFFEKKEHTISSMLISPMKESDYILSKIIVNILNLWIIFTIILGSMYFIKDYQISIHWLFIGILLVSAYYVFIGILLSYVSKDFTALLINYMLMMLVLVMPTLFIQIGILDASWTSKLYWMPTEVSLRLLNVSFLENIDLVTYLKDVLYMLGLSVALYYLLVLPNFKGYATKDLGV